MDIQPPPSLIIRTSQDVSSDGWKGKAARLLGAAAIHLAPLAFLLLALPPKPSDLGGAFGQSVAVTLVSGAPARASAPPSQTQQPSLADLEQRLSDKGLTVAEPPPSSQSAASPTRLSDLFDTQAGAAGQAAAKGPPRPTAGADDDPFARASVSYRGDDPEKTARLRSKAQGCTRGAKAMRLLLIINSEGYLVARPRPLGGAGAEKSTLKTINAVERCAPFAEAATPGPPRSYEIEIG